MDDHSSSENPEKPRILVFVTAYHPLIGGAEIALGEITRRMPDVFFDIVTPRYSLDYPEYEIEKNVSIHRIGPSGSLAKWLFPITGCFKGWSLSKEHKYNAIHSWQASHAGGAAWNLSLWRHSIPFILTLQEGKDLPNQSAFVKFFRNIILKRANKITAISNYLADYARSVNEQASVMRIPNGVDVKHYKQGATSEEKEELKKKYKIKEGDTVLITTSRLVYKNGIDDVLYALSLLKNESYKFLILGTGDRKQNFESLSRKLGIDEQVHFFGDVPNQIVPRYLSIADMFIRPSRSEGLGVSFLEAMAAGVPIIATLVGGIPDFLKDEETGLMCKPDDPQSIVKAIEKLKDDKLKKEIIQNARSLIESEFTWDKIAKQYREIYK
ncbi:MAG: glycosyltransferase family 4 protein [Parcubacteria group bacterium]